MEKVTMAQGIEEILYEAHAYGLRDEVLDAAGKMQTKSKWEPVIESRRRDKANV